MPYKDKADRQRWVEEHRPQVRAVIRRRWQEKIARNQAIADAAKDRPCADCGETFPLVAMDFDHIAGEKIKNVSRLVRDGCGVDKLLAEIAKCEVVCSNCHRVRTFERLQAA